jgi:hypothetical protein
MEVSKKGKWYAIGIVKWKKETEDQYGPRTDMMIDLVKTNMPDMTRLVMVVAQRSLAAVAAERPKKVQVMITFDRHSETNWRGKPIVKIKAKTIEPISWEAIDALSYNKDGQYDPIGTVFHA